MICPKCKGTGIPAADFGGSIIAFRECSQCHGTGHVHDVIINSMAHLLEIQKEIVSEVVKEFEDINLNDMASNFKNKIKEGE